METEISKVHMLFEFMLFFFPVGEGCRTWFQVGATQLQFLSVQTLNSSEINGFPFTFQGS